VTGNRQDAPAASVPTVEDPLSTNGHADVALLFQVKFVVMLGLFPVAGTGKISAALPVFSTVTVSGLSLLVDPISVAAKARLGGSVKSSFSTMKSPSSTI